MSTANVKREKDLGVSMMYGHVYVAQISLGAQLNQTVKATRFQEAEAYPGPSLIIAYSPCEEHGYDLALSHDQMRQLTALPGFWPPSFDPRHCLMKATAAGAGFTPAVRSTGRNVTS